jgi:hypothetical protein
MRFNSQSDRRRNRNHRRPSLESLEGRQLLSLGAQFPGTINTTTRNADFDSVNASSVSGAEVVVWTHQDSSTLFDIRAQRLNNGKLFGPEILVATGVANAPASVAIDNQGYFVVAWTQIASNGNTDVLAQAFNPSGSAIGGIVPVATGTFAQTQPSVAMDAFGDFVVAYTRNTNNNNPDIFAKLYNANEQLVSVVPVATTAGRETNPSVAMTPDGRFDVAYEFVPQHLLNPFHFVELNQYGAQGQLLDTRTISATPTDATIPSVSVDNFGNAVVAWEQNVGFGLGIQARRVSSTGALGPVLTVNDFNDGVVPFNPSVALKRDGSGAFVVAYEVEQTTVLVARGANAIPPGVSVEVSEVASNNQITYVNAGSAENPAVSINNSGQYLLTYTSFAPSTGDPNITGRLGQLVTPVVAPPPGPHP